MKQLERKLKDTKAKAKGFTLIELIVVIAIIGVLSAIVLVALDPGEQINRAKDARARQGLSSVVSALQAYYTSSANASSTTAMYPPQNTWVATLQANGDLKGTPDTAVTYLSSPPTANPSAESLAYVRLYSKRSFAEATPACPYQSTTALYYYWRSATGQYIWSCGTQPTSTNI